MEARCLGVYCDPCGPDGPTLRWEAATAAAASGASAATAGGAAVAAAAAAAAKTGTPSGAAAESAASSSGGGGEGGSGEGSSVDDPTEALFRAHAAAIDAVTGGGLLGLKLPQVWCNVRL